MPDTFRTFLYFESLPLKKANSPRLSSKVPTSEKPSARARRLGSILRPRSPEPARRLGSKMFRCVMILKFWRDTTDEALFVSAAKTALERQHNAAARARLVHLSIRCLRECIMVVPPVLR